LTLLPPTFAQSEFFCTAGLTDDLMNNKTVFSLVNSAVNVTLPAFADERRAAAPLLLGAGARRCPAHTALSSKPTASRSGC